MKKLFTNYLIISLILLLGGCLHDNIKPATNAIDDAITKIEQQSSNWQTVLKELESKLTDSAQSTIKTEVQNTLIRAESAAGTQVKCIVDFTGDRVLEELRQIRAGLTGQQINRQIKICQVVPDSIEFSLDPNRRNQITFDGYNFDSTGIQVLLNERQGSGINQIDVSRHLYKQSHYHMTLNLGENGVNLTSNSQSITLKFDSGDSTIPIIHPFLSRCETRDISTNIGTRTYMPPWDSSTGDREFFGRVDINAAVTISMINNRLMGKIYMKAEQYDDDHTRAEGTDEFDTGYSVPEGWRFDSILSPSEDSLNYRDRTWEDDQFDRGSGLVKRYVFVGDTPTEEAGTRTKVTVTFNPVRIRIVQTQNCSL